MTTLELALAPSPAGVAVSPPKPKGSESRRPDDVLTSSKIMIVDDEPLNVKVAQKYLQVEGCERFVTTTDSREAIALLTKEQPDVLLLDIMMPHVSGLDILTALRADKRWAHLPVVILSAAGDQDIKRKALDLGALDFLAKPVDPTDLIPRVRNALTIKQHHDHLESYSHELEAAVLRRTAELTKSRQDVIHCLARAAEFRDDDTGQHVLRVGRYARLVAEELGWEEDRLAMLEQAAQLHDIGKIGIPDAILLKPGKLTPEEFEVMQKHTAFGKRITESLPENEANVLRGHAQLGSKILGTAESPVLALAATIALTHHEKWDGSGYPLGLAGDDIPIEGRITAIADVFDALSSRRPYKPPFPLEKCLQIIEEGRGKHFDPTLVDAFFRRRQDIVATQIKLADLE